MESWFCPRPSEARGQLLPLILYCLRHDQKWQWYGLISTVQKSDNYSKRKKMHLSLQTLVVKPHHLLDYFQATSNYFIKISNIIVFQLTKFFIHQCNMHPVLILPILFFKHLPSPCFRLHVILSIPSNKFLIYPIEFFPFFVSFVLEIKYENDALKVSLDMCNSNKKQK